MRRLLLFTAFFFSLSLQIFAQSNQTVASGGSTNPINFGGAGCYYSWTNSNPSIGLPATGAGNISSFTAISLGSSPITAVITATPAPKGFAYITNNGSSVNSVSVINVTTNTTVATIPVGFNPDAITVNHEGTLVYVGNDAGNVSISVISTETNTVTSTISLNGPPSGMALSPDDSKLYVSNGINVVVINTSDNSIITSFTLGQNTRPENLALSPDGSKLYVSNSVNNDVFVVNTVNYTIAADFAIGYNPHGIALSPDGSRLYVPTGIESIYQPVGINDDLEIVNTANGNILATIPVGQGPYNVTLNNDGSRAYVANSISNSVSVINTTNYQVVATIPVGPGPNGLSSTADGSEIFVTNNFSNNVSVINTANNSVTATVTTGANPASLGNFITPASNCSGSPTTFTITVTPSANTPVINAGTLTGIISSCSGVASSYPNIQQIAVSGSYLTSNVMASAPSGFEVSLAAGSGYAGNITLNQTSGILNNTIVYVRSAAGAVAGQISGNLLLSSPGATTQNVAVSGTINDLASVNAIPNQAVNNGASTTEVDFTGTGNSYTWINDTPSIGLSGSGTGNIGSFKAVNNTSTAVVATITVTPVNAGFGYVVNNLSNTVTKFNLITNTVAATIPVDQGPISVCVTPGGTNAYVTNAGSNTVSVINSNSNSVIADIPVGNSPQQIAISPDGGKVYIANYNSSSISVISTATNSVIATINLDAGFSPNGIVFSPDGSKLYVANTSGQFISIINTADYSINFNKILVGRGPTCLAISPDGSRIYTYNQEDGTISEVNTLTNTQILVIRADDIDALAVSKDGGTLYSAGYSDNNLNIINTATGTSTFVPVDESTHSGLLLSADGNSIYVINRETKSVSVINASTHALIATVPAGSYPLGEANSTNQSCAGSPVTFTITVNPSTATITAGPVTGTITACVGTASASPNIQQFTVAENVAGITAIAPTGFEVSLDGTAYSNSVSINHSLASNSPTIAVVYVRSAASDAVGPISGNVVLNSPGAANVNIAVSGTVNPLPTVNAVANQTLNSGSVTAGVNFTGTGNLFTWTNDTPAIGLPASGTGNIGSFTAINSGSSPITATITVTPQVAGLAYITNNTSNSISVINTSDQQVVNTISINNSPDGIAVSPDGLHVYSTNYGNNTLTILSTATNTHATIATVPAPIGVYVSRDNSKYYVASNALNEIYVYNANNNTLITQVNTGKQPLGMASSPDGSKLYVANSGDNTVSIINTATNTVTGTFTTNNSPSWMVVSPDGSELYVSNFNSNNISVINTANGTATATIPTNNNPTTLTISPDGSRVYVVNQYSNNVSVINTATNTIIATIPVGNDPLGSSLTSDGSELYVTNNGSETVSVISTATNTVTASVDVGNNPTSYGSFISPAGCPGIPVTYTITINPTLKSIPTISGSTASGSIIACEGTASASPNIQQFILSGSDLSANITLTSPSDWEISLSENSGYAGTLTLLQNNGTVSSGTIYIRSAAVAPAGNNSGNIVITSTGAATVYVAVNSVVNALPIADAVISQTVTNGQATSPINFTGTATSYSWVNDTLGIGLAVSGTGDIASFTGINNTNNPITASITATPLNSSGCSGIPIIFTITVNPTPPSGTLSATANLSPLSTIYGTPSPAESFTVSGTNILSRNTGTANLTGVLVSAPAGFEVSVDDNSFNSTTTINNSGTISAAPVYIRLVAKTPVGNYSGNVILSTGNAASVNVLMPVSTVSPAPLTVTADNLTKPYGAINPDLTVTYTGFVNNDGPAQLDTQPNLSTIATAQSPVGQYPILVDGASSPNYTITYLPGILTIEPALSANAIPNTFTPNGDGINDTWEIKYLSYYPRSTVNIFDRWGQKVFTSVGYPNPWDGRYKGVVVPSGTYYYVIDPKNGQQVLSGWLAVIK